MTRGAKDCLAVTIIGAGLAGLTCALTLVRAGISVAVLEGSDGVGGRVRTDLVDDFRLDRGFQVFFTAYPEARRLLDYQALDLRAFAPGALVRFQGQFHRVVDPFRRPLSVVSSLLAPVGTLCDKLAALRLRRRVLATSLEAIFAAPERTTEEALREEGVSNTMLDRFFRPFLGGIFLGRDLSTSSRMSYFVYRMLSAGDTVLPACGMGTIPAQIAAELPGGTIRLRARVTAIGKGDDGYWVRLENGDRLQARTIVVATEGHEASRLTGAFAPPTPRPVTCLYFAADRPPVDDPLLILDGEGRGPVTNLCVPSRVAPTYAPPGAHLISATVLGSPREDDMALLHKVREQLGDWFGPDVVSRWRHLQTYHIPFAQFDQRPGTLQPASRPVRLEAGLYLCGDHVENASINGAMRAGRRAAEAILADCGGGSRS
jgi:phytoene dehydrogenase-like protein